MLRQAAPLGAVGHIWNIENVGICKMAVKGLLIHKMVAIGDIIIYKTAIYFMVSSGHSVYQMQVIWFFHF